MRDKKNTRVKEVNVTKEIEKADDLFALPTAVAKVLELSRSEDTSIDELAAVVSEDPALTGRLLKIANSPLYGLNQRINSVHNAVMALGVTTVKCLALSAAIFDPSKIVSNIEIDIRSLYGNIISVASTCRKLASVCRYEAPEEAFISGLLHQVGFLFFLQRYPEQSSAMAELVEEGGDIREAEKLYFGVNHAEAGGMIARKWGLPSQIVSSIENHLSFGYKDSALLDDIVRLGVALNLDINIGSNNNFEEKIARIVSVAGRIGVENEHLDSITATTLKDTINFAKTINLDIGDYDELLIRANQEIFKTYMSIQKLFKERQELTRNILDEERKKGVLEAKQIAISTLSHYINNATMVVYGQSQMMRLTLKNKTNDELIAAVQKSLDTIDDAVRRSVAVLEEISELNDLDDVEFFDQSQIINIDERIKERLKNMKDINVERNTRKAEPVS